MSKITEKVEALAKPVAEEEGCELWAVEIHFYLLPARCAASLHVGNVHAGKACGGELWAYWHDGGLHIGQSVGCRCGGGLAALVWQLHGIVEQGCVAGVACIDV